MTTTTSIINKISPFTVQTTFSTAPKSARSVAPRTDIDVAAQNQAATERRRAANKHFYMSQEPELVTGIQLNLEEEHLYLKYLIAEGALYQRRRQSSCLQNHLLERIPAEIRRTLIPEGQEAKTGIAGPIVKALMHDIDVVLGLAVEQERKHRPRRSLPRSPTGISRKAQREQQAAAQEAAASVESQTGDRTNSPPPASSPSAGGYHIAKVAAMKSVALLPLWKC